MTRKIGLPLGLFGTGILIGALFLHAAAPQRPPWLSGVEWPVPKAIDPGGLGKPPSDAIVLFDGKDLSAWEGAEKWKIEDGVAICGSSITTKQAFGDCQLHVEWASPAEVKGTGQQRGNSGIFFMGYYEIQILDSYENETYVDGMVASIYKQRPPFVNASRKPGEWQTFDIIFKAPRFDEKGKLREHARVTVLHNGVVVQHNFELLGRTNYRVPPYYEAHPDKLPLSIQYHGSPVRFRNIWIRELEDDHEELLTPLRNKLREIDWAFQPYNG
ncbi:MAG TPA: DUF1080 domain-containing protein [Phycisphaerae bacterium]|nr:DUF1080 domain-containing protein [Phycisphaerae bacterium]HOQ87733.1 DUF1080 domain-containing protein [Phycisphaerae bacterium]